MDYISSRDLLERHFNLLVLIGCLFTLLVHPCQGRKSIKPSAACCDTYKATLSDLATVEFDFLISILTTQEISKLSSLIVSFL